MELYGALWSFMELYRVLRSSRRLHKRFREHFEDQGSFMELYGSFMKLNTGLNKQTKNKRGHQIMLRCLDINIGFARQRDGLPLSRQMNQSPNFNFALVTKMFPLLDNIRFFHLLPRIIKEKGSGEV